jgi:hypothetical protein
MSEINVSQILQEDCGVLSASQFELGPEAGQITWSNCMELAEAYPIVGDKEREDVRRHFRAYGAWDHEEINSWTDQELSAMVWQEAAAGMREFEDHCDYDLETYYAKCESGSISGRLTFNDDVTEAWIYIGC